MAMAPETGPAGIPRLWRDLVFSGGLTAQLVRDRRARAPGPARRARSGSTVAIVGGELFNKGAQAMTFTVVDQLRRRDPEIQPVLLSGRDYEGKPAARERYSFEVLPWGTEVRAGLLAPVLAPTVPDRWPPRALERIDEVLADTRYIVDVNGLSLTSEFGFRTSISYLSNLAVARRYGLPIYLLPQSFGPFDYPAARRAALEPFLRTYLPYPKLVFARERNGLDLLTRYTERNLEHAFDLVLQYQTYKIQNIYRAPPELREPEIAPNAVGLVPNAQLSQRADAATLRDTYRALVEALLDEEKIVYVFRHATEDLGLCREIKALFPDEERVVLLEEDFSAVELERIISRLQLLVGSRYHSVIHAYRNQVPALVIGWAVKYRELVEAFDQTQYFFDGREALEPAPVHRAARELSNREKDESATISARLDRIRRRPVLDRLP